MELCGHADTCPHRYPDIYSSADGYEDSGDVSYVDTSSSVSVTFDYASGSHTDSAGGTDGYAGAYRYSSADADSYGCSHRGTEFNTGSHRDTVS